MRTRVLVTGAAVLLYGGLALRAADAVKLAEPETDQRAFKVSVAMEVTGKLETPREDRLQQTPLEGTATLTYEERRLPGGGRDAEAYRSVRVYEKAQTDIKTGDFQTVRSLRPSRKLIVTEGTREGLRQFSPAGALTYEELELLQFPGDSLGLLALLNDTALEPGEVWKPSDWVLQFVTGIEASEKAAINCKLESVTGGVARVQFSGEIRGADLGARCVIKVSGHYLYDIAGKYLKRAEVTQEDTREAGVLNPAFGITAKAVLDRKPLDKPAGLADEVLKANTLESNEGSLLLIYEQPQWGVRFFYGRDWHVFHQTPDMAILRMMQQGGVVAQMQLSPVRQPAKPGEHVDPEKFKSDIKKQLGGNFQQFLFDEPVKRDDKHYHYRVIAVGGVQRSVPKQADGNDESKKAKPASKTDGDDAAAETQFIPFQWIYNLLAAPDGRQAILTFVLEADQLEKFKAQDAIILSNFQFLPK